MTTQQPYRPTRLRATFETWIVPEDKERNPLALAKEIPGSFEIEIRLSEFGRRSVYRPFVMPTLQRMRLEPFALSKLPECKSYVESQFKRKLSDWKEV